MILALKPMLEPLKLRLTLQLGKMAPNAAVQANEVLKDIESLEMYSKVTAGLMGALLAARNGSEDNKEKAMAELVAGVEKIHGRVEKLVGEMRTKMDTMPAIDLLAAQQIQAVYMKALLLRLGRKLAQEMKDPENRHNPKVRGPI